MSESADIPSSATVLRDFASQPLTDLKGGVLTAIDEGTAVAHGVFSSFPTTTYGAAYAASEAVSGTNPQVESDALQAATDLENADNQKISDDTNSAFSTLEYIAIAALVIVGIAAAGFLIMQLRGLKAGVSA